MVERTKVLWRESVQDFVHQYGNLELNTLWHGFIVMEYVIFIWLCIELLLWQQVVVHYIQVYILTESFVANFYHTFFETLNFVISQVNCVSSLVD